MNMFEVCAKCGHVGKMYFVEKCFAVEANTAKDAAEIVRQFPRVKHHHKDAIRYVERIDEERFNEIKERNSADPYFHCKNIQEQNAVCTLELISEAEDDYFDYDDVHMPKYYGKKKLRNPKKYYNNYLFDQRYVI